jgi:thioredoxin
MAHSQAVTMENFDDVMDSHPLVVLDFWASWCGPCKTFAPVFETLAEHHSDIFFGTVDTEKAQDLAQAFQVRSVPTVLAFKNGDLIFEKSGLLPPHALERLITDLRS